MEPFYQISPKKLASNENAAEEQQSNTTRQLATATQLPNTFSTYFSTLETTKLNRKNLRNCYRWQQGGSGGLFLRKSSVEWIIPAGKDKGRHEPVVAPAASNVNGTTTDEGTRKLDQKIRSYCTSDRSTKANGKVKFGCSSYARQSIVAEKLWHKKRKRKVEKMKEDLLPGRKNSSSLRRSRLIQRNDRAARQLASKWGNWVLHNRSSLKSTSQVYRELEKSSFLLNRVSCLPNDLIACTILTFLILFMITWPQNSSKIVFNPII